MMVGAFECLPLGILQIIYSLRVAKLNSEKINLMGTLSLITTWFMFGSKVAKIPELHHLWEYREKQKKKCTSLAALKRATQVDDGAVPLETGEGQDATLDRPQ